MKKRIFKVFALIFSLCLVFGAMALSACGEENGTVTYTITLSCEDQLIFNGLNVQIKDESGNVTGEQAVKNGAASFTLEKGTYTVGLAEKAGFEHTLDYYIYNVVTVTADAPSATLALLPADAQYEGQEKIEYRVKVVKPDNTPVPNVMVQLCGGPMNVCNNATADADGVATFSLPAGDYDVHVESKLDGFTFDNTAYKMDSTGGELVVSFQAA